MLVKELIVSHQTGVQSLDIKISVFFLQLIKVNSSESHKQELLTPRIARYIRLVIVDVVGENLCLKMEVHGCPWTKHGEHNSS